MTKRFLTIFLFVSAFALAAQSEHFKFRHLSVKDGLCNNQVNDIMCDSNGFMWICTSHGLSRYDGYEFRNFIGGDGNPSEISDNNVSDIQEDGAGRMWLHLANSYYAIYDTRHDCFTDAEPVLRQLFGRDVRAQFIYVDERKNIWVSDFDGNLFRWNADTGRANDLGRRAADGHAISAFSSDRVGVAVVHSDGRIEHFGYDSTRPDFATHICPERKSNAGIWHQIYADNDGDYWVFRGDGLYFIDRSSGKSTELSRGPMQEQLRGKLIKDVIADSRGRIWLCVEQGSVTIIDKKRHSATLLQDYSDGHIIAGHDGATCISADSEGGIWIGTFKHGVACFNPKLQMFRAERFRSLDNLTHSDPDVVSLAEDYSGNIWTGIDRLLIRTDPSDGTHTAFSLPQDRADIPESSMIVTICPDRDGKLWLGSYSGGLMSFDGREFRRHVLEPGENRSAANRTVRSLAIDANGYLWIGTWGAGIYGMDTHTGRTRAHHNPDGSMSSDHIFSIVCSDDGKIYAGTTYGMIVYNPLTGRLEKLLGNRKGDQKFSSALIHHMFEDSRRLLWLSTNNGVCVYDRMRDSIIHPAGVLDKTMVYGTVEDKDKNMWVISSEGVHRIIVNGNDKSNAFTFTYSSYDSPDNSDNRTFNIGTIIRLAGGDIAMGGTHGLSYVNPDRLQPETVVPDVRITGIQLFNNEVRADSLYEGNRILDEAPPFVKTVRLDHAQNIVSVTFSAMSHLYPGKIHYRYKLEGFDSDWMETTANKVTYTNLSPGDYTLRITAVNNDGFQSERCTELRIAVAPPFYLSWKAYVIYALAFLGLVWLAVRLLRRRERQRMMVMKLRQEAEHIQEMDNLKMKFFTNISHDLRTPLTLILTPLEYVIDHMDDSDTRAKLEVARNNAHRLLTLVNQLLDFRKSDLKAHTLTLTRSDAVEAVRTVCDAFSNYSEHRNIDLTFYAAEPHIVTDFDEDKLTKIVTNLLSNAFKFTPEGGRVDVSVRRTDDNSLEIRVADNGCGISDDDKKRIFERFYQARTGGAHAGGSGVGLNLVQDFVTLHGGTVRVVDNADRGSVFIVTMPITESEPENTAAIPSAQEDTMPQDNDGAHPEGRPTILIVDDNEDFRLFMKDYLSEDYNVCDAPDGDEAWRILPDLQPDIVISDIMMPGTDGTELCRRIKNDIRTSHIMVVLLTARAAKEHELEGLDSGADDYITKPFNLKILSRRIANMLQRRMDARVRTMEVAPGDVDITPLDQKLIRKAVSYVEENMASSNLTVEDLSSELAMSRVNLYKKMVAITGKTPKEFIRILRLKRAARLLTEGQLSIAESAYQTGFSSLSLFRKYFKQEFGVLPSEYQEKFARRYNESLSDEG